MAKYDVSIPLHYALGLTVEAETKEEAIKHAYEFWYDEIRALDEQLEDSVAYAYRHNLITAEKCNG